jgi:hypothetical protein
MAQQDNGPASGNASLYPGSTATVEVHIGYPVGPVNLSATLNPQHPTEQAVPVDPTCGTTLNTQTKQNFFFGSTAGVRFLNPA